METSLLTRTSVFLTSFKVQSSFVGLARSLFALSLALTFICTDTNLLFSNLRANPDAIAPKLFNSINFFLLFPPAYLGLGKWIAICVLLLVISGWRPRYTCIPHAWIHLSFINSSFLIEGGDQIASNISLLLIPILLHDPRKNHWETMQARGTLSNPDGWTLISNFFFVLIRIQVAFIYLHSAMGKLFVEEWRNGTAVYYWFNDPSYGLQNWMKTILNPLLAKPYLIVAMTWGVMAFETLLFMALVMPARLWNPLFRAGLAFHLAIVVFHGLPSFFITMSGALILYLKPVWRDWKVPSLSFSPVFRRRPLIVSKQSLAEEVY